MSHYPTLFNVPRPMQPPTHPASVSKLPLTLLALIISYLDNVADLARVCQTSRVLHYMTLPQLYRNITLTSYESIRYKDDQAEGIGSASPFSMGLNALVTRNVCALVRTLALQGHWREHDLDEYSRAGRVPDDAFMLNIAVRAAVDRCTLLESFKWDLNTKLLPNVYVGLTSLQHLESFHLRFPSSRSPRPTVEIPPLPNLRSFTMTDYDPLCFPDDISTLLLHATKLHTLKMHFSPRMRDAGEPSVQLLHFFRKNVAAKRRLKLKTMQLYHLFAMQNRAEIAEAVDAAVVENVTFLNTFGVDEDDRSPHGVVSSGSSGSGGFFAFLDNSWINPPNDIVTLKSQRHDRLSKVHAKMLGSITGLERLYLVNARHKQLSNGATNGATNGAHTHVLTVSPTDSTPPSATSSSTRNTPTPSTALRDLYLDAICTSHGSTLRHLILPARWQLPTAVIARLIRACPNITQLALSMECNSFAGMRMLIPFLKNLWAIRILSPACDAEARERQLAWIELDDGRHERQMGRQLAEGGDFPELKYVGLGRKCWEVGGLYESVETVVDEDTGAEREDVVLRRRVWRITEEDVRDVEIWKMDSLDVV